MLKLVYSAGLAVALSVSGAIATAPAHAQGIELRVGPDGVRPVIRDQERERDRDRRDMRSQRGGGCSEREARSAARAVGLRDPEVVQTTRSRVVVEGETRRGLREISFANERGCPEL